MNLVLLDQPTDESNLPAGDPRARHIRHVLRASSGDRIRVGVIDGPLGDATVTMNRDGSVTLVPEWKADPYPPHPIIVVLGHPRPPVLQRLVRDLASMRVAGIEVFSATLSERSYLDSSAWKRIDALIREGLSQGGHTTPPLVSRRYSLAEALAEGAPRSGYFGSMKSDRGDSRAGTVGTVIQEIATEAGGPGVITVAIGPERGFTGEEEGQLIRHGLHPVNLGSSVLRTETATILLTGVVISAMA